MKRPPTYLPCAACHLRPWCAIILALGIHGRLCMGCYLARYRAREG